MQITRSSQDTARGPADRFTGHVFIDAVAAAPAPSRVTANLVHFMPGARTHWHRHPLSQTVFVTEGVGLCQRRGGPVEVIRPGDRVLFEADEEHWHGAAPNRLMVHLAINEADDEHAVVHWLTPVSDDEYAAPAAGRPLAPTTIERRDVGPNDVLIAIEYAGICHSDIHTVSGDWGPQPFPVVPGHEIVGIVTETGADVTRHRVGDRVGVGCMVNSCGECANCRNGDEQYCLDGMVATYAGTDRDGTTTQGGYSTHVVVDAGYVLRVREGIDPAAAAPLLCAGITTFSPLRRWGAGPGRKIAVVGLGGLGHMAVKLAHAMGAEVTVLSQSLKKQEDGLHLGADDYFATSDPETFEQLAGRFDLIVNTVSAAIDIDAYLSLLRVDGALVNVGAPAEPLSLDVMSLIGGRRTYAGSMIGGIAETQEMLDFCAEHGIGAEVEVVPAEKINEAYERVLASDVRYRFVIDAATLG